MTSTQENSAVEFFTVTAWMSDPEKAILDLMPAKMGVAPPIAIATEIVEPRVRLGRPRNGT
jgi:hypothetical protein